MKESRESWAAGLFGKRAGANVQSSRENNYQLNYFLQEIPWTKSTGPWTKETKPVHGSMVDRSPYCFACSNRGH
jgi:hypothetical protein